MNKIKMEENEEIKTTENNLKNKNKRLTNERKNNKNIGISGSNIHLHFVSEEKNTNHINNDTASKNNNEEFKTMSEEDINEEIYCNNIKKRKEEEKEKEQQLLLLYYNYLSSFENKKYENVLYEIDNLKNSCGYNSDTLLKIQILKLRCLLKIIKQHYFKLIIFRDKKVNLMDIMKKINKFRNECEIISNHISPYNTNNYEAITQVYSKFLLYLAFLCKLKEEFIKSMSYITLGVNLMKIFFIRRKIAEDIKTYILYCQLLLLLINNLIGDYNYKSAIFYCQVLFKVINVAFKIINKKQLAKKYFFKFFIYLGFNYLFIGLCLEQKEDSRQNNENCYYSYKQANFFFSFTDESKKKEKTIFQSLLGQSNENSAFMLTQLIISKFKDMLDKDKTLDRIKQKNYKVLEPKVEKTIELEKIENMRNDRYKPIENNIYNSILTQNTQNHIEKLDNDLISVIYKNNEEKKKKRRILSQKTKNFLYNCELYNILLSNHLRKYIIETNKFQFNHPMEEKQSTDRLRRYLNRNIKIKENRSTKLNINNKINSIRLNDNSLERKKLSLKFLEKININNQQKIKLDRNIFKRFSFKNRPFSSNNIFSIKTNEKPRRKSAFFERNEPINLFKSFNQKYNNNKKFTIKGSSSSNLFLLKKYHSEANIFEKLRKREKLNTTKHDYYKLIKQNRKNNLFNINNNIKNIKKINNKNAKKIIKRNKSRFKYSNSYSFLENDFERKHLDKSFFSPKYFKKVSFLDSFFVKELSFQKRVLKLKENNSKTFFGAYEKDFHLNLSNYNNIFAINNVKKKIKENTYKTYLMLNDKANEESKKIRSEENTNKSGDINLWGYPKNMHKIFKKYIQISKNKREQKYKIYSEYSPYVKKNNESILLNLDSGLKELNYIISYKNKQLKNFSFSKRFKIIN